VEQKILSRQKARQRRDGLSAEYRKQADEMITQKLVELVERLDCRRVCLYASVGSEVDTWQAMEELWRRGVEVYLPRTRSRGEMDFFRVENRRQLVKARFQLWEPEEGCPSLGEIPDLIVVPALAFDRQGWRVGYGGGYYDRYLQRMDVPAVGLCYEACMEEQVPVEPHDRKVQWILTEGR
jgi:5-formyltetrahydrofolate cyclo-ligase